MKTHCRRAWGCSPTISSFFPFTLPFLQYHLSPPHLLPLPFVGLSSVVLGPLQLQAFLASLSWLPPPFLGSAFGPCFFVAEGLDELKINSSQLHHWGTVSCFLSVEKEKVMMGPLQPPPIRKKAPQGIRTSLAVASPLTVSLPSLSSSPPHLSPRIPWTEFNCFCHSYFITVLKFKRGNSRASLKKIKGKTHHWTKITLIKNAIRFWFIKPIG